MGQSISHEQDPDPAKEFLILFDFVDLQRFLDIIHDRQLPVPKLHWARLHQQWGWAITRKAHFDFENRMLIIVFL